MGTPDVEQAVEDDHRRKRPLDGIRILAVEQMAALPFATQLLADAQVAVWDGHNYAVEAMIPLGLDAEDGAVRAGISVYTTDHDVDRLLAAVVDVVDRPVSA